MNIKKIIKNRKLILEGLKNNIFKKEAVEEIASERMNICITCPYIDLEGDKCEVKGTQPCCGKCGCSLKLKLRSLASSCGDKENPRWEAVLSDEEEVKLENLK
jgi:hypothetical protein